MMGLEKVDSFKHMAMFGIYVRFLGCTYFMCADFESQEIN